METPEHLRPVYQHLRDMGVSAPPDPWRLIQSSAVGGLTDLGFAPDSDLLLVVSGQGRGVFDCISGDRVARDRDESSDYQQYMACTVDGIGPLAGQRIRMAGLHGGGLTNGTVDGWSISDFVLVWPHHSIFLVYPWKSPYEIGSCIKLCVDSEFRAAGFSPTGRSIVVGTSSDLTVWGRTT